MLLIHGFSKLGPGRAAGAPRRRTKSRPGAGSLGLFGAALLAKETALVFLPVVALAEAGGAPDPALPGASRRPRAMLRWLLPYAALAAIWLALHLLVTWHRPPPIDLDPARRSQGRLAALTMFPRSLPLQRTQLEG